MAIMNWMAKALMIIGALLALVIALFGGYKA